MTLSCVPLSPHVLTSPAQRRDTVIRTQSLDRLSSAGRKIGSLDIKHWLENFYPSVSHTSLHQNLSHWSASYILTYLSRLQKSLSASVPPDLQREPSILLFFIRHGSTLAKCIKSGKYQENQGASVIPYLWSLNKLELTSNASGDKHIILKI